MSNKKEKQNRKSNILLLVDYTNINLSDKFQTIEKIKNKLRNLAPYIIGELNAITPYKLFENIYNIEPTTIDIYRRKFWYDIIKLTMKKMRSDEEIFFIIRSNKIFVLESTNECIKFCGKIDKDISSLFNLKEKAKKWVLEKKYKKLKKEVEVLNDRN